MKLRLAKKIAKNPERYPPHMRRKAVMRLYRLRRYLPFEVKTGGATAAQRLHHYFLQEALYRGLTRRVGELGLRWLEAYLAPTAEEVSHYFRMRRLRRRA